MEANYEDIKRDMDARNTSRKRRSSSDKSSSSLESVECPISSIESDKNMDGKKGDIEVPTISIESNHSTETTDKIALSHLNITGGKTRKKREELSSSACRSMRFERNIPITMRFGDTNT